MKKPILALALPLLSLLLLSCSSPSEDASSSPSEELPTSETSEKETSYQLLLDNTFQNGFSVSPASGSRQDDGWIPDDRWARDVDLTYGDSNGPISWLVAQHGDIYSLNDKYNKYVGEKPTYEDGYYTFFDESKKMSVNPSAGSLYLELNASKEYVRPRKSGEQWCHLLLNQGFMRAVSLKEVSSVDFTIDLELKKWEDHMDGQANRDVHACQFLMYLVIKSEAALDANDFFWFGIPFFDNRYPNGLPESGLVDAGGAGATSKFIYGMPSSDYLPKGLPLGSKQSVNVDIKPYIGNALVKARSMGYFVNSELNDLTFQSMNIGFEIPGTYDCGIEISNFTLTAQYL